MALKRGGLGRGLDSLIPDKKKVQAEKKTAPSKDEDKSARKAAGKKTGTKKKKKSADESVNVPENMEKKTAQKADYTDVTAEEAKISVKETEKSTVSMPEEKKIEKFNGPEQIAEEEADNSEEILSVTDDPEEILSTESGSEEVSVEPVAESGSKEVSVELATENESKEKVLLININLVEPNREQPRKKFRDEGIEELASSIAQYGIIQPLLVQKRDDYFEIIAGERRWRAARKAGLKEVPVILKDYSEKEAVEISLIENIQREDLNPIEEALAYERLINEFEMTQEQVAGRVSKSRSAVTNSLRLLKLESDIRAMLISGELSEGHARAILGLPDPEAQKALAERVVKDKLSVRDTEKIVKKLMGDVVRKVKKRDYEKEAILSNLSEQLKTILGTKVSIHEGARHKGRIEIEYYSDDELNRIFEMLQTLR